MEPITRHSPIPRNGAIYRTYGNSPYPVHVYCTCCAKNSKAKSTVPARQRARFGMQTQHTLAPGHYAFQFWQPTMSTCAFPSAHGNKKRTAYQSLPYP